MEQVSHLDQFLFGIYPYICIAVFLFGSLVRFDREQYTWKSDSSELLYRGQLRVGSTLFHLGILGVFGGHIAGLLTPMWVFDALHISPELHQIAAIVMGGITATMAYIGLIILMIRRFRIKRVHIQSTWRDKFVLIWLFLTVTAGYSLVFLAMGDTEGKEMLEMMSYVHNLVAFDAAAAVEAIANVATMTKIHVFLGFTFFFIFPFTRMVHVWSGFAAFISYVPRAWQLVRRR